MANPTYIPKPSPVSTPENASSVSDFGSQVIDANQVAIQGLGSAVVFEDAAGVTSPIPMGETYTKLTVPTNAARITFSTKDPGNGDVKIAADPEGTNGSYNVPYAFGGQTFDCARQGEIYVMGENSSIEFAFTLI